MHQKVCPPLPKRIWGYVQVPSLPLTRNGSALWSENFWKPTHKLHFYNKLWMCGQLETQLQLQSRWMHVFTAQVCTANNAAVYRKNMYTIRLQHLESEATQGQNSTLRELSFAPDSKSHRDPLKGSHANSDGTHTHTRNSNSLTRHWGPSCRQPIVQQQTLILYKQFFLVTLSTYNTFNTCYRWI